MRANVIFYFKIVFFDIFTINKIQIYSIKYYPSHKVIENCNTHNIGFTQRSFFTKPYYSCNYGNTTINN